MALPFDIYEDVVRIYIKVIELDSPEAAAAVGQIQIMAGSRAALRATHVITLIKIEIKENRYLPNLHNYAYLFEAYPEALPLLEAAIDYCLRAWNVENVHVSLKNGNTPHNRG